MKTVPISVDKWIHRVSNVTLPVPQKVSSVGSGIAAAIPAFQDSINGTTGSDEVAPFIGHVAGHQPLGRLLGDVKSQHSAEISLRPNGLHQFRCRSRRIVPKSTKAMWFRT